MARRDYVRDWKGRFSRVPGHKRSKNTKDLKVAIKERRTSVATAAEAQRQREREPKQQKQFEESKVKVQQDLSIGRRPDGTIDYDVRAEYMDRRLVELRKQSESPTPGNPGDTKNKYYNKDTGEWDPERKAMHDKLIAAYWERRAAHVPNEGKAMFSGGLGGAGKGYTLKNEVGIGEEDPNFLTVNPDLVKELMAEMDANGQDPKWIPTEFDPNMTPMELSPVTHEEASDLAKDIADMAYRERKNVVWDLTMASEKSIMGRFNSLRDNGYEQIEAIFVDISVERSMQQARERWINGMERYQEGRGTGGRFLPSSATRENLPSAGSSYMSKNREVFEAIKGNFDGWRQYENIAPEEGQRFGKVVERARAGKVLI